MTIEKQEQYKALGAELTELYNVVDYPCSDEEEQGNIERIAELENALRIK